MAEIEEIEGEAVVVDTRGNGTGGDLRMYGKGGGWKIGGKGELNDRQRLALEEYIKRGKVGRAGKAEAGVAAGYGAAAAVGAVDGALRAVKKEIVKALENKGVTEEKIAGVIAEAMEARKLEGSGEGATLTEDHAVRLRAVQEANKLKDNYPAQKIDVTERNITVVLGGGDVMALMEYEKGRRAEEVFAPDREGGVEIIDVEAEAVGGAGA